MRGEEWEMVSSVVTNISRTMDGGENKTEDSFSDRHLLCGHHSNDFSYSVDSDLRQAHPLG